MHPVTSRRNLLPSRGGLAICAFVLLLSVSAQSMATDYTYELSDQQPWAETGESGGTTQYVTVRAYVPGSNTLNYRTIPIYTPSYASEANALGDVVGSVFHIYGSGTTAFVDPYDGPRTTIIYPAPQILHTRLMVVNDDRLAIGTYNVLGGHAAGKGFIYDLVHDRYTPVIAPNTVWTDLSDLNNLGQIVGTSINDDGATRKGFVYDCQNGFTTVDVPGSTWTVPRKIDDEGNVYGLISGIAGEAYFIARPTSSQMPPDCSLVPRDDVAQPVAFMATAAFELSGDLARGVRIADFDGGGINDLLVYHEPGKTILYLGESAFDDKVRYYGDEFNTLAQGMEFPTQWDFNNDGLSDRVTSSGTGNLLFLSKEDGSFHYVPQQLPGGNLRFGDLDGDGLVDLLSISGAYASIHYQVAPSPVATEPVPDPAPVSDPVVTTTEPPPTEEATAPPAADPEPAPSGDVPAVSPDAEEIESWDTIAEVRSDSVLLGSGEVLWFNADSIIKYNDASTFEIGQPLEFKAWENPDGALIGIKVEVAL